MGENVESSDLDSAESSKLCLACKKFTENYDESATKLELNKLLERQLHKIENLYKCSLDKMENLRLKYKILCEKLEYYKEVAQKLTDENETLHKILANRQDDEEKQNWKDECVRTLAKLKDIEQKLEKKSSQTVVIVTKDSDSEYHSVDNFKSNESEEVFHTPPTQSLDNEEIERLKCLNNKLEKENEQFVEDLRRINNELECCALEKGQEILGYKKKFDLLQRILCTSKNPDENLQTDENNETFLETEMSFVCKLNQQLRKEMENYEKQNMELLEEIKVLRRNEEEMKRNKIGELLKEDFKNVVEENHYLHQELMKMRKNAEINVESTEISTDDVVGKLSKEKIELFNENKHLKEEINLFYKRYFNGNVNISEVIIRNLRELIRNLHTECDYLKNKSKNHQNELIRLQTKLEESVLRKEIENNSENNELNEINKRLNVLEEANNLFQMENKNLMASNDLLKQKNAVLEEFYNRIKRRTRDNKQKSEEMPKLNKIQSQIEDLQKANSILLTDNSILLERVETLTNKLNEKRISASENIEKFCKCSANLCTSEVCFKKFTDHELEKKQLIINQLKESIETSNELLHACEKEMEKMRQEKEELANKVKEQEDVIKKLEEDIRVHIFKLGSVQEMLNTEKRLKSVERLSVLLHPVIKDLEEKMRNFELNQHKNENKILNS